MLRRWLTLGVLAASACSHGPLEPLASDPVLWPAAESRAGIWDDQPGAVTLTRFDTLRSLFPRTVVGRMVRVSSPDDPALDFEYTTAKAEFEVWGSRLTATITDTGSTGDRAAAAAALERSVVDEVTAHGFARTISLPALHERPAIPALATWDGRQPWRAKVTAAVAKRFVIEVETRHARLPAATAYANQLASNVHRFATTPP